MEETNQEQKIYTKKCKTCGKEIKGFTENQVKWLFNVHKMTHEKEK